MDCPLKWTSRGLEKVPHRSRGSRTRSHILRSPHIWGQLREDAVHLPHTRQPGFQSWTPTTQVTFLSTLQCPIHAAEMGSAPLRTAAWRTPLNNAKKVQYSLRDPAMHPQKWLKLTTPDAGKAMKLMKLAHAAAGNAKRCNCFGKYVATSLLQEA